MYYGDYYRGDYYRGDPGLFGAIGSALKGVAKVATGVVGAVVPGPAGAIARTINTALQPKNGGGTTAVSVAPIQRYTPAVPTVTTSVPTIIPPASGVVGPPSTGRALTATITPSGQVIAVRGKRRRMNYGNVKALRRADRRIDGFVGVARKALKHTNYKVVSRGAGRGRSSRGVITRSEAARALRA